jgi:hypothetical protein
MQGHMRFGVALWCLLLALGCSESEAYAPGSRRPRGPTPHGVGAAHATTIAPSLFAHKRSTLFVHYHKTGNVLSKEIAEICKATNLVDKVCFCRAHTRRRPTSIGDNIACHQIKCDQPQGALGELTIVNIFITVN